MKGLPDRKLDEKEVEALRRSDKITEVSTGYRYTAFNKSEDFSQLEITLQGGRTEKLIYAGEDGEWVVVKDTHPGDTGKWECETCGEVIQGERAEPPLHHVHNCEEAGPNSLSFIEE